MANEELEFPATLTRELCDAARLLGQAPVGIVVVSPGEQILYTNPAFCRLLGHESDELIGRPVLSLVHPEDRALGAAAVRQLTLGLSSEIAVVLRLVRRDGVNALLRVRVTPLRGPDDVLESFLVGVESVETAAGVTSGNSLPRSPEARELRALQRRVHELATLHQLARLLAEADDLQLALPRAVAVARRLFRATVITVATLDTGRDDELPSAEPDGCGPTRLQPALFGPLVAGLFGRQRPLLAVAREEVEHIPAELRAQLGLAACSSLIIVPLHGDGRETLGVLALGSARPRRPFTAADLELATKVAGLIAAALRGARVTRKALRAAARAERERLALELHDSAVQSVYSMMLMAEGWSMLVEQGRMADPAAHLRQLAGIAHATLKDLQLLTGLRQTAHTD